MTQGASLCRIDARLKVTGQARFEGEVRVAGMLHAGLVTSPLPSARVLRIDATRARQMEGFVALLTHESAPRVQPVAYRLPLQDAVVHFAGQPVAIVLAETACQASFAAAAVDVEYEPLPALTSIDQARDRAFSAREAAGGVAVDSRRGDPDSALSIAEVLIERRYTTSTNNHHPMEPHVALGWWEGDRLTLHTASQAVFATRQVMANCFGVARENVRIVSKFLGGGFGSKGGAWMPELMLTALAARAIGRPVRLELTRAQMFTLVGRRPQSIQNVTLGARRDGRLTAIVHESVGETSTYGVYADPNASLTRWLYLCPNVATSHRIVPLNVPQSNPMRAPGEGTGSFAVESALDELAYELDLDPIELRIRNFAEHDQHLGRPWSSNGLLECYRVGADAFGWSARPRAIGALRETRRVVGWGMASAAYPVFRSASEALVRLEADGHVTVRCGTQDLGTGTYTVLGQLAADILGIGLNQVTVELGDTDLPEGPRSGGSMATASFTPAVERAARDLRIQLLNIATRGGPLEGLKPDDLTLTNGCVQCASTHRMESLVDLIGRCAPLGLKAFARVEPDTAPRHSSCGFGAVFAEVSVDLELSETRITRLTAAYALGRILNPQLARSQLVGGLIGGIGMALHEATIIDARLGRIIGDNLADYMIPVHADMPTFDVRILDEDDPHLEGGVKGIGMIGVVGTAAAIANAVFHATGRRVRNLPLRLEDTLPRRSRES